MSAPLPVRVTVQDVWDEAKLDVAGSLSLGELKRLALQVTRVMDDPDGYIMKFRGAELFDEAQSLSDAGIVPNAALIVMPRRRRPVR